jgi:hypothetical protein
MVILESAIRGVNNDNSLIATIFNSTTTTQGMQDVLPHEYGRQWPEIIQRLQYAYSQPVDLIPNIAQWFHDGYIYADQQELLLFDQDRIETMNNLQSISEHERDFINRYYDLPDELRLERQAIAILISAVIRLFVVANLNI